MRGFLAFVLLLCAALGAGLVALRKSDRGQQSGGASGEPHEPVGAAAIDALSLGAQRVPDTPARDAGGLSAAPDVGQSSWADLNAEAILALEAGEYERAIGLFEHCLEGSPEQPIFAKNLAEALARSARLVLEEDPAALGEAIAVLERALELDGARADLRSLLERWKASQEAEGEFWTDETAHFELSYDGQRTELLKHGYAQITLLLEDVYNEFHELLNHEPVGHGDSKIRVLLYEREQFTRITGIGYWAGGAFDGTIRIPVAEYARERRSFERVLRHELLHAFVQSIGGKSVPSWLNEGLAQWFEDGTPAFRVRAARVELKDKDLFTLKGLQDSFSGLGDEERIALSYSQSLAFLDYLFKGYGDQLVYEMIRGCAVGRSAEETFKARTAQDLQLVAGDFAGEL